MSDPNSQSRICSIKSDPSCFQKQIMMNKKPVINVPVDTKNLKDSCQSPSPDCIDISKLTPQELAETNFGSLGIPEYQSATMYALNRINKDKCNDTGLLAKYAETPGDQSCDNNKPCPDGQVCKDSFCYKKPFKWVDTPTSTMWRCPDGVDDCSAGVCRIVDDGFCIGYSQLPWIGSYPEGQSPVLENLPQDKTCENNDDCKNLNGYVKGLGQCVKGADGKKTCSPTMPYLEWHPALPWSEDDNCGPTGNSANNSVTNAPSNCGRCVFGNHALRKFCEFPQIRRKEPTHGATDVPPFCYNQSDGSCRMTPSYCKYEGISYSDDGSDGSNTAIGKDRFACNRKNAHCYVPEGQQIGEFVLGKTMFRDKQKLLEGLIATAGVLTGNYELAAGADALIETTGAFKMDRSQYFSPAYDKNYFKEDYENLPILDKEDVKENISKNYIKNVYNQLKKGLQSLPSKIEIIIDDKYMKNKKIISKDVAGKGINIYSVEWDEKSLLPHIANTNMSFISSELKSKYPKLITKIDGIEHLVMNKKDIRNNELKRIYFFSSSSNWVNENIVDLYMHNYGK